MNDSIPSLLKTVYRVLGGVCGLGGYDAGTLGLLEGANILAMAVAVLLSLTFAKMPGSTLR